MVCSRRVKPKSVPRTSKIGIVGGGPAGLSLALSLRDAGFDKVQVFEKEDDVGGKCLTVEFQPGINYELGASSMSGRYREVGLLIDRYQLTRKPVDSSRFFDRDQPGRDPTKGPWESEVVENVLALARRFSKNPLLWGRDLRLLEPGFGSVTKSNLAGPFGKTLKEIIADAGLQQIEQAVRTIVSGIGYGYIDEVPSAYLLKYLALWMPRIEKLQFQPKEYELFQVGYQGLFKRVADDLGDDIVKRAYRVTHIERDRGGPNPVRITFQSPDGPSFEDMDKVILACPLDEACRMLNSPCDVERRLLHLKSYTFHTILVTVENFAAVRWGFLMHNHYRDRHGYPVLSARRHIDLDRVVFYVLDQEAPASIKCRPGPRYLRVKDDELNQVLKGGALLDHDGIPDTGSASAQYLRDTHARLATELESFNLRATPIDHVVWKYFPHFSVDDVKKGYPVDLEELQGARDTYYAGEVLDFSAVERVLRYSKHLVATHFA